MFVREELVLDVDFDTARVRIANLTQGGWLRGVSEAAYDHGLVGLVRVGPVGDMPGMSKLVRVQVRDLVTRDGTAVLTLRWEATGVGGRLFPALDADITLAPAGDDKTRVNLVGVYRPPLGGLGAGLDKAILHRVAAATIRSMLGQVAGAVTNPELVSSGIEESAEGTLRWPAEPEDRWSADPEERWSADPEELWPADPEE